MSLAVFERRQQGNQAQPGNQRKLPGQRGRMQTFPLSSLPPSAPDGPLGLSTFYCGAGRGERLKEAGKGHPREGVLRDC